MTRKVLVGVNTSQDSMATVLLLKLQNFEVTAQHVLTKPNGMDNVINSKKIKCHEQNKEKLLAEVCDLLGVQLFFSDQRDVFYEQVVSQSVAAKFVKEYMPTCMLCHKIKVNALYQKTAQLQCEFIATGHYAKVKKVGKDGLTSLYRYTDAKLDQSQLLLGLDQNVLSKLLLPLGDLSKEKVVAIVKEHLPHHFQLLSDFPTQNNCEVLLDPVTEMKRNIAPSLNRKNRLCLREKNTYFNEVLDNTQFEFGENPKLGFQGSNKDKSLTITGYNYSYQTVYISEQGQVSPNYYYVQIMEYFGEPSVYSPLDAKVFLNDEVEGLDATIYFKSINYALVVLKKQSHAYVPTKSSLTIMEESRNGWKVLFYAKVVSQGNCQFSSGSAIQDISKITDDLPF